MKRNFLIGTILLFTFFCLFNIVIFSSVSAETKNETSKYTNVFKNEQYYTGTTIQTLNQKNDIYYINPVNQILNIKASRKKGEYGIQINGEFYLTSYTFEKEGIYVVNIYDYIYEKKENCYKSSSNLRETFYLEIINMPKPELKEKYYYQQHLNSTEFVQEIRSTLNSQGFVLSAENERIIIEKYDSAKQKQGNENISLIINNVNVEFEIANALLEDCKYSIYFDTPITIDLNFFKSVNLNKYVSELYDVFYGLKIEAPEFMDFDISLTKDLKIIRKTGTYELQYTVYNNFYSPAHVTTIIRKVYVFDSINSDKLTPVLKFEPETLCFDYASEVTEESIYEGIVAYDNVKIFGQTMLTNFGIVEISSNYDRIKSSIRGIGTYEIEYRVRDESGNIGIFKRNIVVKDVDAPKVLRKYNVIEVDIDKKNEFKIQNYYKIIDNYDTFFKEKVERIDYDGYSIYTISVSDSSGNETNESIIVRYTNYSWWEKNVLPVLISYKRFWKGIFQGDW